MKHILAFSLFTFAFSLPAFAARVSSKPVEPQAPVITYGLIRDEYGDPIAAQSPVLELVKDDASAKVYARCVVGDAGIPGMNYRLSLEIDSAGPRRDNAATVGTPVRIRALFGADEEPLSPDPSFATPAQGTHQRKDFSFGTDDDTDGMPDEWEAWVLEMAGHPSTPADIAAFKPGDDADRDGMTNLQEFYAGTDPFIATDLLKVESFELVPGTDRAKITFRTTFKRWYRVLMAETLAEPNWTPVATSTEEQGDLVYEKYSGTGRLMTIFIDARLKSMFFKVAAD